MALAYYIITHWTHRPLPEMCYILSLVKGLFEIKIAFI